MGIEQDIQDILFYLKENSKYNQDFEAKLRDLNEKVDLMTIRNKSTFREDIPRLKKTMPYVENDKLAHEKDCDCKDCNHTEMGCSLNDR